MNKHRPTIGALEALETRCLMDGNGLTGTYYNGTTPPDPVSGSPSIISVTRVDANINFYWGSGAPAAGITVDKFSARWVGQIEARHSETYTFSTRSDEGVRLWIDGKLVIDSWTRHRLQTDSGTIALQAGKRYDLRMEYYDFNGTAVARLMWQSASQPLEDVPTSQLYAQAPIFTPAHKPGQRIEAENFDLGARDVAYADVDGENIGKAYRNTSVDMQASKDAGGGYNIGWSRAGEWLEYTVDIDKTGSYVVDLRLAALGAGGMFHIEVDGLNVSGSMLAPNTGNWQVWTTASTASMNLTAGRHVLRISQDTAGTSGYVSNVNWLQLRNVSQPTYAVTVNNLPVTTDQTLPVTFANSLRGDEGATQTFLVTNTGLDSLSLSGMIIPSGFSLVEGLSNLLAPGASDSFSVRLDTTTAGRKSGVVQFFTSDPSYGSFAFGVAGTVVAPRLTVKQGLNILANGATVNFGVATVGATGPSLIFTVLNEGDGTMTLSAPTLPDGFVLAEGLAATLAPGASDNFTVRLDTSSEATRIGSITIASSDLNANPFVFTGSGTVSPAVNALISEDFTSGAGGFTAVDGAWSLVNGAYRLTADNAASTSHLNSRAVHNTALAGDFTLTVDATAFAGAAPWANAAVVFGYQDANNYYFFSSNQGNDGATNGIFKVVNGTSTELADAAATITPGVAYQLRVERQGSAIRAYRNGQLVASATDATFTSGQVGVGTRQFQAAFDNFVVAGTAVAPPTEPPAAPSGLTAAAASSTAITLAWADNSTDESGFTVERSTDGSVWQQITTLGANVQSYLATGLGAATQYFFRVLAANAAGNSAYSNTASATTQAAPAPGARPGPDNTGPTNLAALVVRGSMVINTPGVYENFEIRNGTIEIGCDNVTLRNFRIVGAGPWFAIQAYGARQNIVIEDGEISNPNGDNVIVGAGITLRRMEIHDAWDMVRPGSNFTIENSWFHHLYGGATAHADFIQSFGASNVVIRNNFFDASTGTGLNSNITADASNFNWLVEGNTFKGCGFGLHINGVATGYIRYLNNVFVAGSFTYGPVRVQSGLQLIEWSGNTWDNGDPLAKPTVQG